MVGYRALSASCLLQGGESSWVLPSRMWASLPWQERCLLLQPVGCLRAGASEGAPKAQAEARGSWSQLVVAWAPGLHFHFQQLQLNLRYANEASSGQVLEVSRLFTKGRKRNVAQSQYCGAGARKGGSAPAAQPDIREGWSISGWEPQEGKTVTLGSWVVDGRVRPHQSLK